MARITNLFREPGPNHATLILGFVVVFKHSQLSDLIQSSLSDYWITFGHFLLSPAAHTDSTNMSTSGIFPSHIEIAGFLERI